jgi:ribosomal protein S18 acetylase RimI-like enzyme
MHADVTHPTRPDVHCAREHDVSVEEFRCLLIDSGLGRIRPVADSQRLHALLRGANLTVTARSGPKGSLLGIARCVTDFAWCCYLSDLAVARSAQGLGIGQRLLDEVRRQLGPEVSITLVSVPEATGFYAKAGMTPLQHAFWYPRSR